MFKIDNKIISESSPTYIIAEIGINHKGNINLCKKMLLKAKQCGADAAKLQIVDPEFSYNKNTKSYKIFSKNKLNINELINLKKYSKKIGITIFATPGDFNSIEVIKKLKFPAIKISSGLLTSLPLIKKIADTNLPIIFSTGMAYLNEVKKVVRILRSKKSKFAILKCTSLYPAPFNTINLNSIKTLKNFKTIVGYSDHTTTNDACIAAVSCGAKIIEKHFTLNKNLKVPDQVVSADPVQFKDLVKSIRKTEELLGEDYIFPSKLEISQRKKIYRVLVCCKKIFKGEKFTFNNLALKRVKNNRLGIEPRFMSKVIGKKSKLNISEDEMIQKKHFY